MASYTFPIDFHQTLSWKVRNFPDEVYNFNPGDHLTNLMSALLGDSGTGQLASLQTTARINEQIDGMEFSDLDSILGTLLSTTRLSDEQYESAINPFLQQLPISTWQNVTASDASYRERLKAALQAVDRGATCLGMTQMAEAISGVPCDVIETWKVPSVTRFPTASQYEFVIYPKLASDSSAFSPEVRGMIYTVLQHLKPVGTIVTVSTGVVVQELVSTRTGVASSEWFEFQRQVLAPVVQPCVFYLAGTTSLQDPITSSRYWLNPGALSTAPNFAHMRSQEVEINMTNMVAKVQAFTQGSQEIPSSSAPILNTTWGPWISMGISDSSDNFPNGEYPADPSRRSPNGSYIFEWPSQAAYVAYKTNLVEAQGGQVVGNLYRLPQTLLYEPANPQTLMATLNSQPMTVQGTVYGGI